jgi:hypothetical protein
MAGNCGGVATMPLCSVGNTGFLAGFSPAAGAIYGYVLRQQWQGSGSTLAEK